MHVEICINTFIVVRTYMYRHMPACANRVRCGRKVACSQACRNLVDNKGLTIHSYTHKYINIDIAIYAYISGCESKVRCDQKGACSRAYRNLFENLTIVVRV